MERVHHTLEAWTDGHPRVLVLGTMPSPKSRARGMYYGHPQNRFWKTLAALWQEPVPDTPQKARDFAARHGIALWDVLASCDIQGASDASIAAPVANDIGGLLQRKGITTVFTTGKKAQDLYKALVLPATQVEAVALPSTSAANRAHWPDDRLILAYQKVYDACERQAEPQV
jgi:hypoxanthine-DNA glycosylase